MAGLWHLSQQQILDSQGKPLIGARAFFYEADTLTPLTVFADYGLGTVLPNPVTADGFGRFPVVYFDEADGFYRHRITTSGGVIVLDLQTIPIIGPSEGEGGGSEVPVDGNTIFKTGDVKVRLGTGTHSGWVRVNGRSIGSATSGASERANADTEGLFEHIWNNFSNDLCPVAGGRGANAAADFAANKTITLPDLRGRAVFGLDDMGNTTAGRLTSTTITGGATTLGLSGGVQTVTLTTDQIPSHTHNPTLGAAGAHGHPWRSAQSGDTADSGGGIGLFETAGQANHSGYTGTTPTATRGQQIAGVGDHTHTLSIASVGGGGAHSNMPPAYLATYYVKL